MLLMQGGRDKTFYQAARELAQLPPDAWEKHLAIPLLVAFQIEIPQDLEDEDMSKGLEHSRALYAEWEKRIRQEGIKAGMAAGRKAGRKAGIADGERAVVIRQLTRRFGPLPEDVIARIEGADLATLDRWSEQLLTAATLDEVLSA